MDADKQVEFERKAFARGQFPVLRFGKQFAGFAAFEHVFSSSGVRIKPAQLQAAAQAVAGAVQDDVAVVFADVEPAAYFVHLHAHDFAQVENAGGVFGQAAQAVFQRAEKVLLLGVVFRRPPLRGRGGIEPVAVGIETGAPRFVYGLVFPLQAFQTDAAVPAAAEMVGDFVFQDGHHPCFQARFPAELPLIVPCGGKRVLHDVFGQRFVAQLDGGETQDGGAKGGQKAAECFFSE